MEFSKEYVLEDFFNVSILPIWSKNIFKSSLIIF